MIEFVQVYVEYSMQGPQEFLIGCVMPGFLIMVFGKEIKRDFVAAFTPKPTPRKGSKRKAASNRKTRTVQKTAKKAKPKKVKWAKPPKYTPEQLANIERMFRKGRGEYKTDNWAGVPL